MSGSAVTLGSRQAIVMSWTCAPMELGKRSSAPDVIHVHDCPGVIKKEQYKHIAVEYAQGMLVQGMLVFVLTLLHTCRLSRGVLYLSVPMCAYASLLVLGQL